MSGVSWRLSITRYARNLWERQNTVKKTTDGLEVASCSMVAMSRFFPFFEEPLAGSAVLCCSAMQRQPVTGSDCKQYATRATPKMRLISSSSMNLVSDIKLIRTDTTLDLSQKAEKNTVERPALEGLNTNRRRRQACGRWPAHISTSLRGPAPKRPRGLYARAVVTCYSRSQVRTESFV